MVTLWRRASNRFVVCSAWFVALLLVSHAVARAAEPAPQPAPKLKGLLITGGCCHDYARQKQIITEGISQRVSIAWDIVHEGDGNDRTHRVSVYKKPNWAAGYDVIVHNECFGAVDDPAFVESIVKGHTDTGIPAVVLHCSMHSYRAAPTDAWRKLLGVTSRRHEKGGRNLEVKPIAVGHPILHSFPDVWTTPGDELYVIEKQWPQCTPLARAFGIDTNADHTVVWTNEYEKVRVFGTTLGHNNETMLSKVWLDLVSRGLLWTLGKLEPNGQPAAGWEGSGRQPF